MDLIGIAEEVEQRLKTIREPLTVAVMGCVVNGPGEAREADVGLAGGKERRLSSAKEQWCALWLKTAQWTS